MLVLPEQRPWDALFQAPVAVIFDNPAAKLLEASSPGPLRSFPLPRIAPVRKRGEKRGQSKTAIDDNEKALTVRSGF